MQNFDLPKTETLERLQDHRGAFHEAVTVVANGLMCRPAGSPSQLTNLPNSVGVGRLNVHVGRGRVDLAAQDDELRTLDPKNIQAAERDVTFALAFVLSRFAAEGPNALRTYQGRYAGHAPKALVGLFGPG